MLSIYSTKAKKVAQVDIDSPPPQQPEEENRIHWIRESRLPWLDSKIERLNKVATKLGIEGVSYQILDERIDKDKDNPLVEWIVKQIEIIGDAPKLNGYSFISRIIHTEEGNLLKSVPGEELPPKFRNIEPRCDHCNYNRRRKDTFVLREDATNRYLQVGSNCLKDFLGHNSPNDYARYAEMLYDLSAEIGDDSEGGFGGGGRASGVGLENYLKTVYAVIKQGGWLSRTKAREEGSGGATADVALNLMLGTDTQTRAEYDKVMQLLGAGDVQIVKDAIDWARNLKEGDDNSVEQLSDYYWNLSVAVSSPVVTYQSAGIVASLISAYDRSVLAKIMPDPSTTAGEKGQEIAVRGQIEDEQVYKDDNSYTLKTEDNKYIRWNGRSAGGIGSIINISGTIVGYSKRFNNVVTNIANIRILDDEKFQEKLNQLNQQGVLHPEESTQYADGEKVTTNVTVLNTKDIDGIYGTNTMFIMIDDHGNNLVYFSNAFDLEKGEKANITATVKEVGEYNGKPSIKITRAKINSRELPEGVDDNRMSAVEEKQIKKEVRAIKKQIKAITDIFGTDNEYEVLGKTSEIENPIKDLLRWSNEDYMKLTNRLGARYLVNNIQEIPQIVDALVNVAYREIQNKVEYYQNQLNDDNTRLTEKQNHVNANPSLNDYESERYISNVQRSIKYTNESIERINKDKLKIDQYANNKESITQEMISIANTISPLIQQWEANKDLLKSLQDQLNVLDAKLYEHKQHVKMYGKMASSNWLTKIASITFFIDGAERISQPKDMLKLCNDFLRWIYNNVPQDVFKASFHNIEPDGNDYDQPTGTMNIYLNEGDNPEEIKKYLQTSIKDYFDPMDISVKIGNTEISNAFGTPVIRINIIKNGTFNLEKLPEINISNTNAYALMEMLGITQNYSGQINAKELIQRISQARNNIQDNTVDPSQDGNMIDFGRSYEQIERYLDSLETIAMRALNMENSVIVWG